MNIESLTAIAVVMAFVVVCSVLLDAVITAQFHRDIKNLEKELDEICGRKRNER